MAKYPKFMICENPMAELGQEYILHTQKPRALFKVNQDDNSFEFEIVDLIDEELDPIKMAGLMRRMSDWWLSYIKWEDSNSIQPEYFDKETFANLKKEVDFVDAHAMSLMHGSTFSAPTNDDLFKIKDNDYVKVSTEGERFWIKIVFVNFETRSIIGIVDSKLLNSDKHGLKLGDVVEIGFHNIYAIDHA